ncbi:endonuclease [Marinoscillum pacificum]|uniref:endonuclease n=1 Tax=Marinoscillum pacificum TaxID=392723 RepID=UPI0021581B1A|nr:endonuclease [Marinoscillum pacificum]
MKVFSTLFLSTVLLNLCVAQSIPDGYYDGTESLTGEELKTKLHVINSNHKVYEYGDFRDFILPELDEDPENSDNIILFYKNNSIPKANFAGSNQADYWNREHTWPKSHGFASEGDTAYTDVHNLRPSDATVNTSKSNKDFGDVEDTEENAEGEAPDTYTTADFFEPRDEIKGDVARILFYMDMRYESSDLDLELMDRVTYSGDPELGVLSTLIQWHEEDPVDQYEIDRHEKAYGYQGNRNPFIDHPEWVGEIWGSTTSPYMHVDPLNFSKDFGTVSAGSQLTQQYTITGYNLTADLTVSVNAPFKVSSDGETFEESAVFSHVAGETTEIYTVYLQFAPTVEDEASYTNVVTHSTEDANDITLEVFGTEGGVELISIATARELGVGAAVYVTGVVIDAGNNSSASRVIYDGTAGVVVRSFDAGNESGDLVQGDSVLVSGTLSSYNNLLQIEESPIVITLIAQGVDLPESKVLTIDEVDESYESQLVTINEVEFADAGSSFQGGGSAGNFTITDATGALTFRIGSSSHPLVGTEVPAGIYNVTGFVGQFGADYQLSPRTVDDLVFVRDVETTVLSVENEELKVYPNPVYDHLNFKFDEPIKVIVFNMTGSKIVEKVLDTNLTLSTSKWDEGIYLINVLTSTSEFTYKIIKE